MSASPRGRRRRLALLALVVLAMGGGLVAWRLRDGAGTAVGARTVAPERLVPDTVRIRVEVLNATGTRGLARRATHYLRDRGFDVVAMGNAPAPLDSSRVLVHTGRTDWGQLAAQAMGGAPVEARPDTSRYLDVTVLIGASWRPPPQPFDP